MGCRRSLQEVERSPAPGSQESFGWGPRLPSSHVFVDIADGLVHEQAARDREAALRAQAEANAQQARVAAAKSAQVAQFMKDMLKGAGPHGAAVAMS